MIRTQICATLFAATLALILTGCDSKDMSKADLDRAGARMHNNVGMEAFAKRQFVTAAQRFSMAVRIVPEYVDALNNLGRTYYMMGKFGDAMSTLKAALALAEKEKNSQMLAAIHANIGDIHRQSKRYEEALASYHKVLSIVPNSARVHYELGQLYLKKQEYQEALWRFDKVIELDINYIDARRGRALVFYLTGQPKAAWREVLAVEKAGYKLNEEFKKAIVKKLQEQREASAFRPGS
ncbi:MAG: tetratricopeptide repeat protein [Planctomycetota bacterium]|jgi:tetratricopeptide (TPR) repeat protein